MPLWYERLFPLVAVLGLLDTLYLINVHNNPGVCSVNETTLPLPIDCGAVAQSEYATILGIPLAYLGFLYYLAIILIFLFRRDLSFLPLESLTIITIILAIGILFSIYLVYIQLAILKVICLYCMGSALSTTILISLHLYFVVR